MPKKSEKPKGPTVPVDEKVFTEGAKAWLGVGTDFSRAMYSLYLDVFEYAKTHTHSEIIKLLKGITKQTIESGAVVMVSASLSFIFGALRGDVLTRNDILRLNEYKQDVWWNHYFSDEAIIRTLKETREENAAAAAKKAAANNKKGGAGAPPGNA